MRTRSILVAEDETFIRIMLGDTLRDAGYDACEAATGDQAAELLEQDRQFDMLITDVEMPGSIDGLELARRWKHLFPDRPVLISSAYIRRDGNYPADALLPKPYRDEDLLATVARLLAGPEEPQEPVVLA